MDKPLVSYLLLSYNEENYIEESLISVLNQDYPNLEIIVSDDCSDDLTFSIIQRTIENYRGPHKVIVNQMKNNNGIGSHVSYVLYNLTHGKYYTLLGGDDVAFTNHVSLGMKYLMSISGASMIDFCGNIIDSNGRLLKKCVDDKKIRSYQLSQYLSVKKLFSFAPGRIAHRSLIDDFTSFRRDCPTEDFIMVFRSLIKGGYYQIQTPMVYYRIHNNNVTKFNSYRKLNQKGLMLQLKQDANIAYNKRFLTKNQLNLINKRVNLEYRDRLIKFKMLPWLPNLFRRLVVKVFRYLVKHAYLWSMKFSQLTRNDFYKDSKTPNGHR